MKAWRISIILAIVVVVIAAMLIPALKPAKIGGGPHHPSCINNMHLIQAAKDNYAGEFHITDEAVVTKEQLLQSDCGLAGKWPQCPNGGEYSIGALHESPRCSYHTNLQITAN